MECLERDHSLYGQAYGSGDGVRSKNNLPQSSTKHNMTMIKLIITAIAAISLASCESLTVKFDNPKFGEASYDSKGGLIITPKAITIIEPQK